MDAGHARRARPLREKRFRCVAQARTVDGDQRSRPIPPFPGGKRVISPPHFDGWLASAAIAAGSVALAVFSRTVVAGRLRRLAQRTETALDDFLLDAVAGHLPAWICLAGVSAATHVSPLSSGRQLFLHKLVVAGFFISLTIAASQFVGSLVRGYSSKFAASLGGTTLVESLARATVLGMGILLLLSNLGISVTPILTALGVGSLAVALALQDTLSNLFAGLHIVASNIVEVGDYIKLDTGHEGFVVDVGWRATRIRESANNLIVIPNTKLSQAVVVNFDRPEKEQSTTVEVGVGYDSDLERVEQVTLDVARQVMRETTGAVPSFEPLLRFHTFGDSAIGFTVVLRAKHFSDRSLLKHALIKKLHDRYRSEGIEIPFPQRTVRLLRTP